MRGRTRSCRKGACQTRGREAPRDSRATRHWGGTPTTLSMICLQFMRFKSPPSKRAANKCNEARVAVGTRQRLQQQNTVFTDPNHVKYDMCLVCTFQESLPSKRAANKCNEARVALSEATRCTPKAHCKAHANGPTTHKPIRYTIRVSLLPAPRDF